MVYVLTEKIYGLLQESAGYIVVSRSQTLCFRRGIIAFSISARLKKGLEEFTGTTRTEANRFCWALIDYM